MTIIEWYESICRDDSFNDIQTLMQKRGSLSAASVKIAKQIKTNGVQFRRQMFEVEIQKKRLVIDMQTTIDPNTNKVYTSAKANDLADVKMYEAFTPLEVLEAEIEGDKLILRQINQVLEAMRQDIAEMRSLIQGKQ